MQRTWHVRPRQEITNKLGWPLIRIVRCFPFVCHFSIRCPMLRVTCKERKHMLNAILGIRWSPFFFAGVGLTVSSAHANAPLRPKHAAKHASQHCNPIQCPGESNASPSSTLVGINGSPLIIQPCSGANVISRVSVFVFIVPVASLVVFVLHCVCPLRFAPETAPGTHTHTKYNSGNSLVFPTLCVRDLCPWMCFCLRPRLCFCCPCLRPLAFLPLLLALVWLFPLRVQPPRAPIKKMQENTCRIAILMQSDVRRRIAPARVGAWMVLACGCCWRVGVAGTWVLPTRGCRWRETMIETVQRNSRKSQ